MNERLHESLSALMDGEVDELEIRRLLNQTEQDESLLDKWTSYQMIGAIMRKEPVAGLDLAKGVRQALDGEPMDDVQPYTAAKEEKNWRWFAASGAVAASVMFAVLVGVQWQQGEMSGTADFAVASAENAAPAVAVSQMPETVVVAMEAEQQRYLEEAQRRLQEYVLQHNEQNIGQEVQGMLPLVQTVKFNQPEVRR